MSRTKRNHNHRMKLGTLSDHQYKDGQVRDGTPQHYSSGCDNHGSCEYCVSNKMHSTKKREPIIPEVD